MATIGERYDSIMIQIEKAETAQSYQTSSGDFLDYMKREIEFLTKLLLMVEIMKRVKTLHLWVILLW